MGAWSSCSWLLVIGRSEAAAADGHVGLSPRVVQPTEYTWALDDPNAADAIGTAKTLRSAKRAVERAFRANYSWRFPASRGY